MLKPSLSLLFLAMTNAAIADPFSIGGGVTYSHLSGFRSYGTVGSTQSRDNNAWAPTVEAAYRFNERVRIALSYATYRNLVTNRVAPTSDIFGRGGIALQVLTPYKIEEDIHQLSLTPTFTLAATKLWSVDVGPSLDIYRSRAKVRTGFVTVHEFSFTETDYRLGAIADAQYRLGKGLSAGVHYRYAAPPGRNIHSLGASIAFEF